VIFTDELIHTHNTEKTQRSSPVNHIQKTKPPETPREGLQE
jgi:hypothetical protein